MFLKKGDVMTIVRRIEYMCSHCGKKAVKSANMGRPDPGRCPRKLGNKPHTWVKNREL